VLPVTLHRRSKYSQQTCTQLQPLSTKNIISNERNYKDMKKNYLRPVDTRQILPRAKPTGNRATGNSANPLTLKSLTH
jgi:hypothetical protein